MSVQTPLSSPSSHHGLEREVVWIVSWLCHEKAQCWWEGENGGGSVTPLAACRASRPSSWPPTSLGWWSGSLSLPWRTLYFGFIKDRLWGCPFLSWFLSQLLPVCLWVRGGHRQQSAQQQGPEQRPAREELPAGLLRALRLPPARAAEGPAQVR